MSRANQLRFYSNFPDFLPYSTVKRIPNPNRNVDISQTKKKTSPKERKTSEKSSIKDVGEQRENQFKIQMLSRNLFEQIFKNCETSRAALDPERLKR